MRGKVIQQSKLTANKFKSTISKEDYANLYHKSEEVIRNMGTSPKRTNGDKIPPKLAPMGSKAPFRGGTKLKAMLSLGNLGSKNLATKVVPGISILKKSNHAKSKKLRTMRSRRRSSIVTIGHIGQQKNPVPSSQEASNHAKVRSMKAELTRLAEMDIIREAEEKPPPPLAIELGGLYKSEPPIEGKGVQAPSLQDEDFARLKDAMGSLSKDVGSVKADVAGLKTEVADTRKEMCRQFDKIAALLGAKAASTPGGV
jgi:hypothetical protein